VLTGVAAHDKTGPALMLSFVVAGLACIFAAMCYAEFASMAPVAGSAYTYAYATLGELFAWIIGWDLILEYAVASMTVAHGWSKNFQDIIGGVGVHVPKALNNAPFDYDPTVGRLVLTGSLMDLPGILIAIAVTIVLVIGIRESAGANTFIVGLKLAIVLFVIVVGAFYVNPANWHPFAPYGLTGLSFFGHTLWGQTGRAVSRWDALRRRRHLLRVHRLIPSLPTPKRRRTEEGRAHRHHRLLVLCTVPHRGLRRPQRDGVPTQDQHREPRLRRLPPGRPALGPLSHQRGGGRGSRPCSRHDAQPAPRVAGHGSRRHGSGELLRAVHPGSSDALKATILTESWWPSAGLLPACILATSRTSGLCSPSWSCARPC
jgi:hypothetical protein